MSTGPRWRDVLSVEVAAFVGRVAFPRLAYWARWPTRVGPRGLAAYIAWNTAFQFAMRQWFLPGVRREVEAHERAAAELRERLGREPTYEEIAAHRGIGSSGEGRAR